MQEPLQDRFDVRIGAETAPDGSVVGGDTYTFKIPTIKYDIEVGYRAADVRRRAFPEAMGNMVGLDTTAVFFSRYCAYLELYLIKATTLWPYGFADDDLTKVDFAKPPKVDFEKFPPDRLETVYEVGQAFDQEVARFLRRGNPDRASAGQ